MRKKILRRLIGLFLAVIVLSLQVPFDIINTPIAHAVEKSKVAINYEKLVIAINQSINLKIKGTTSKVIWKSSNTLVASVSEKGIVTGLKIGKTTITATVGKEIYSCQIVVSYIYTTQPYEHREHFSADYMANNEVTLLDMKSAFEDFKSVGYKITGIYASVNSEKTIYIEGLDKNGKSLGIVENNGLSYIHFDKGTKLRIMNPDSIRYTIDFIPAKPTVIKEIGYYTYDDLTWYKLKDGNIQAPIIFAIKNSYMEYIKDTDETKISGATGFFNKIPHDTGDEFDPNMMNAWQSGYFTSETIEEVGNLKNLKIYVDQYKVYIDKKDIFVYGKNGLDFPQDYMKTMFKYRDLVKEIAGKKYLPYQTVWNKPLRFRYTYQLRSSAEKNYMSMNIEDVPSTYIHEMTHYYHLESMDYGCQISAWTEGIAQVLTEDALISLGQDTTPFIAHMSSINNISEKDLKDFENYFLNVGYEDCYTIGYHFIRFIQNEYGKNIVYKINSNIDRNKQLPKFYYISPSNRSKEADQMLLQAIKDATSKDVFTRFVNEVVKLKMN